MLAGVWLQSRGRGVIPDLTLLPWLSSPSVQGLPNPPLFIMGQALLPSCRNESPSNTGGVVNLLVGTGGVVNLLVGTGGW